MPRSHSKSAKRFLRLATVQMKFRPSIAANTAHIADCIRAAAEDGADAVLLPECALTGYRREFAGLDPTAVEAGITAIARLAKETHCNVLLGSPTREGRKWFNSLLVFDRRGREVFRYSKIHLTEWDARFFTPGDSLALFRIDGVTATAIICHERRFPELVRLPVMMGAEIVFHPNAGLDSLAVSRSKRGGRDGIAVRAFENQVFYAFANSAGPQGGGLWSAGDSKIVAPDGRVLALAGHSEETILCADLDLSEAGRRYAREALEAPAFLRRAWRQMLAVCRQKMRSPRRR